MLPKQKGMDQDTHAAFGLGLLILFKRRSFHLIPMGIAEKQSWMMKIYHRRYKMNCGRNRRLVMLKPRIFARSLPPKSCRACS